MVENDILPFIDVLHMTPHNMLIGAKAIITQVVHPHTRLISLLFGRESEAATWALPRVVLALAVACSLVVLGVLARKVGRREGRVFVVATGFYEWLIKVNISGMIK